MHDPVEKEKRVGLATHGSMESTKWFKGTLTISENDCRCGAPPGVTPEGTGSGEDAMRSRVLERAFQFHAAIILVTALCAITPLTFANASELMAVRLGITSKDATRIVFDLSGEPDYALSGDDAGHGRLSVELKGASSAPGRRTGAGHIASYEVKSSGDGASEVIFEFAKSAKITKHFIIPPSGKVAKYRLVIDLASADKQAFLASFPKRYGDLTQVLKAVTKEQGTEPAVTGAEDWPIIVIDAGHGGSDPGASSAGGIEEKAITLAAAKQLAEILSARGRYRIVMTRADDARLNLQERSKLAREAGADLFISLHADAHKDASLRGGSVYTISEEGRARSARTAEALGDHDAFNLNLKEFSPEVSDILFDKAQTFTENNSSHFAETLVRHLKDVTPLLNNAHRRGDLFVLLAPDVPAALFEMAYISNKADVGNLTSRAWRTRAMTAVADAIDAYFDGQKNTRHAFFRSP